MIEVAKTLVLLILGLNLMLWIGGFIEIDSFTRVYAWLPEGLQDFTTYGETTTPSRYDLQTTSGDVVRDEGLTNFLTITLDFIQDLPLLGGFISMIIFVFDLIWNMLFGFIQGFSNAQIPSLIAIPLTIILSAIQGMAILDIMLKVIAARGGTRAV